MEERNNNINDNVEHSSNDNSDGVFFYDGKGGLNDNQIRQIEKQLKCHEPKDCKKPEKDMMSCDYQELEEEGKTKKQQKSGNKNNNTDHNLIANKKIQRLKNKDIKKLLKKKQRQKKEEKQYQYQINNHLKLLRKSDDVYERVLEVPSPYIGKKIHCKGNQDVSFLPNCERNLPRGGKKMFYNLYSNNNRGVKK